MQQTAERPMVVQKGILGELICFYEPVIIAVFKHDRKVCSAFEFWVIKVLRVRQSARVVYCKASQP